MFTGLRIGITTARALAHANGLPLRPVSSLAAMAAGIGAPLRLPLIDARRGEVFGALYEGDERVWPPFVTTPGELVSRLHAGGFTPLAAGDGSVRFRELLEEAGVMVAPENSEAHVVRALHVCRLGAEVPDEPPEAVLPDYLRDPDAKPQS
jgi:tRNA threonylcarbamoyladenosine biosynthesis protein TsaB